MPVNPYSKYIKQYQTNNITTATPEKLMIMLFDGAIQFLQKAKTAIAEKNLQERSVNIESARKIIRELMRTIDLDN
jgi:flagellar protein FliS